MLLLRTKEDKAAESEGLYSLEEHNNASKMEIARRVRQCTRRNIKEGDQTSLGTKITREHVRSVSLTKD